MTKLLAHVKHNVIAYLALFVALGGTSYAAIKIPNNSVGTKQLRNGSVTSNKLAAGSIRGYVAYWAKVSAAGRILSSSPRATITSTGRGVDQVFWHHAISPKCFVLATESPAIPPAGGAANAYINDGGSRPQLASAVVQTFNASGQLAPNPASVAVICP